jgi:starvation-inducible DNA-binding protein
MEQLIEKLKILHASNFSFYLKLHFFHWNVEGPNFPQYHELFGDLYSDVHGSVDNYAEHLRALQAYAPGSLGRFSALSVVSDQFETLPASQMIRVAMEDNTKVMFLIGELDKLANEAGEIGLSNFLQGRMEIHRKHQWMLRATSKQ